MRAKIRLLNTNYSPTNRGLSTVLLSCLTTLLLFLMPMSFVSVTTAQKSADTSAFVPTAIIYDNGPLATGANANDGTAAPGGTQWSEAANPTGNTQQANTNAGISCSVTSTVFRCADDFNVPVGQTWTINQVIVFAYQTGFAGGTSPITAATLRIWKGRPADSGSIIVFGDTTTNRLATSTDSSFWRIFSSVVGTGANPPTVPATNRKVWQNNITVSPAAVLTAGNYWIDWNTAIGTAAHFAPVETIKGTRGVPGWNARQFTGAAWADIGDIGTSPTGAPVPATVIQDFPFKLDGTVSGAPATPASRRVDFDGDNKSDLAVAHAVNSSSQATWSILRSTGVVIANQWGTGVGFATGDVATPEDFDGDGKTDIAVWRSDPTAANFYILQSSNGALRTEQFGKQGDDPTVVDDYDGDGKADVAVWRGLVGAGDPCGGSAVWYWRPSSTPSVNFAYFCWGGSSDKAYPGDFDGDGKADFSTVRNISGVATVLQIFTGGGQRFIPFGQFPDYYLSGDFDADGKMDLASVRAAGPNLTWYFTASGNGQSFSFILGDSVTDFIVPGDYDGDNKTDFAIWRSGAGTGSGDFYLLKTFTSPAEIHWGSSSVGLGAPDYPVAEYQVH